MINNNLVNLVLMDGGRKNNKNKRITNISNIKCTIDENDKVFYGSGGSRAIIVIKDKKAYKLFPIYIRTNDTSNKSIEHIKIQNDEINREINISLELTKNVNTQHVVKYIQSDKCFNANDLFVKCPDYITYLNSTNNDKSCDMLYYNHPYNKIANEFMSYEMEYCNFSLKDYLEELCYLDMYQVTKCLDILFFQIIYTLKKINAIYPQFCHNDLYIRNILGNHDYNNNSHYKYQLLDKTFYVPIKFFNPKINDFGDANLNETYQNVKLFDEGISKDMFNIMYDIYNGACLGGKSLTKLFNDNNLQYKIPMLKKYFNNFFNTNKIDTMIEKNKSSMHWNWNNILDPKFREYIEWSNEIDAIIHYYFYPKFNKISEIIDLT